MAGGRVAGVAAAAVVAACLWFVAGCGGDSNDSASTAASIPPAVTAPQVQRTATKPHTPTSTQASPTTTVPGHPGANELAVALGPFRDCLQRHGVRVPQPGVRSGAPRQQAWGQSASQRRAQIQARIACIPELPPRLRRFAERLKKRYEQRTHRPAG